ncbi:Probable phosphoglycerate mutase [hydrothermal vent metagenome]|uniref:Probable phosphoglycerate mutase n=1 Tax=hydrothermal vent metagenome TaxID=652676 RepID=A0A160TRJ0_9ZZZZ
MARPCRNYTGFFLGPWLALGRNRAQRQRFREAHLATRLTLLCHAATTTTRVGGFADPAEPLDGGGLRTARAYRIPLPSPRHIATSPALAPRQTAEALGLDADIDTALSDIDHGQWAGRSLAEIHALDPDGIAAWIADPAAGAPGGETMAAVGIRIAEWLTVQARREAPVLAITHPMVVRTTIAVALGIPLDGALRIDVAPLSMAVLSFNRVWRLQALGPAVADGRILPG